MNRANHYTVVSGTDDACHRFFTGGFRRESSARRGILPGTCIMAIAAALA
jgi:hypothetical protein